MKRVLSLVWLTACMTDAEPELGELDQAVSVEHRAVMVNQKGFVDTDVQFSEFFNVPHTVMAWVMPQFTYNNFGPIFAENGSGMYVVGQADFRAKNDDVLIGNGVDPLLFVQVGTDTSKRAFYNAPTYKKRQWNHIAIVRMPAYFDSYSFLLFVNGTRVMPIGTDVRFGKSETIVGSPSGNLRLGRRTFGETDASRATWQYYGFIDDAAVYKEALTAAEIGEAMTSPWERSTLLAGWTFNTYDSYRWTFLDPKLKRPVVRQSPAYSVQVPSARTSSDAGLFDGWLYVAPLQQSYRLPFRIDEVWRVTQGPDTTPGSIQDVSHVGSAAFCYDFSKSGAGNSLLVASAPGDIIQVIEDQPSIPGDNEKNIVRIETAPREVLSYNHIAPGSFTEVFLGGTAQTPPQDGGPIETIETGDLLAKVGPAAKHLHIGARDGIGDFSTTIPLAFTDYEVSATGGDPWVHVVRGMPRFGQYVRRRN